MRDEIADMGARTPHELMRAVEVSFIRDCAEMAARSSLTRTESRWGLYHDRADMPGRDDSQWGYHLNLRKGPDGSDGVPQATRGPVLRAGPGAGRPTAGGPDGAGGAAAAAGRRSSPGHGAIPNRSGCNVIRSAVTAHRRGPRSRGADDCRPASRICPTPIPGCARTAVATLTEHTPDGYAPALFAALDDADAAVRRTSADGNPRAGRSAARPGGRPGLSGTPRDTVVRGGRRLSARRAPGR